jgi:hypothetical protein
MKKLSLLIVILFLSCGTGKTIQSVEKAPIKMYQQRVTEYTTEQLQDIFANYDREISSLTSEIYKQNTVNNDLKEKIKSSYNDLYEKINNLKETVTDSVDDVIVVDTIPLYPPSEVGEYKDSRPYQRPTTFPDLLKPFNVEVNNLQVTRISDKNMSSNPTGYQMRHDYSKDQCWNADGTEIMLSAYNGKAQILDGNTYEFKRWANNIPSRQRWSYVNPDIMYGVSGMNASINCRY